MKKRLPTLFKPLLAATSALTMITAFPGIAQALNRTSQSPTSSISTPGDWNPNSFISGDALIYGGNHAVQANGLGNFTINFVDTGANPTIGNFTVNNSNLTLGSISSTNNGSGVPIITAEGGNILLSSLVGGSGISHNDYSKFLSLDFNGTNGATLTIQNTGPITLPTNFLSTGGNAGKIVMNNGFTTTFNGTFSTTPGSMVKEIHINSGSTAVFNTNVTIYGSFKINTGAVLQFGPNITVSAIDFIFPDYANPTSKIIFTGNTQFDSRIGKRALQVDIGDGEVNVSGDEITAKDINFTHPNSILKLSKPSNPFLGGLIYITNINNTTGIDNKGRIIFIGDNAIEDFTGNAIAGTIGAPGASLENFHFENPNYFARLQIRGNQIYVGSITTDNDLQGRLIYRSDGPGPQIIRSNIGTPTKRLERVVSARNFVAVDTTTILESGKEIHAGEFWLYPGSEALSPIMKSHKFIMEDNTLINALITTINGPGPGVLQAEVEVQSNATILQDIGTIPQKVQNIKLLGALGSRVDLSGDFYVNKEITLLQPDIVLGDNVIFHGKVNSNSTTYSLGNRTLYFDNSENSAILGDAVVNFNVNDVVDANEIKHGHFEVREPGLVDMSALNSLNLNLKDFAVILPPVGPVGQSYTVFGIVENSGQIIVVPNAKVHFNILQQNPFVVWSYTNGVATRRRLPQNQIDQIIKDIVTNNGGSPTAVANAILLANPNNTGNALGVFQNITAVIMDNPDDLLRSINAMQPVIVEAAEQISEAVDQAVSTIGNRLKSLGIPAFALAQDEGGGIAAGDEEYKYGAWTSAYYGTIHQKARGESPGFKSNTAGIMIGADTMLTDAHTLGIALSYADNRVKHKDSNDGDTSRVHTYTISLYGMQEISDKWFLQGVGLFSRNKINNREQRFLPRGVIEIAKGDFNVNAYSIELLAGHNHLLSEKVLMTTTFGGEYVRLDHSRYQEYGTTNQNLLITKKVDNKIDAIAGISFAYNEAFKKATIIPEIHGNITYDVLNKSPKVTVKLAGLTGDRLVNKTAEQSRIFYNLGGGVSILRGTTECSVGYDLFLGKKYIGHQGSIKVRINF